MSDKQFSSKIGLVMAAAGSAVGLGNIWKFPYMAGDNGGGAFLIVYMLCVALFGMPLLMTEMVIGKRARSSVYGAFANLSGNKNWHWLGYMFLLCTVLIMSFYFVITGWCLEYFLLAFSDGFVGLSTAQVDVQFNQFVSSPWKPAAWALVSLLLTSSVLWLGVNKGIERLSKILMPLLLLIMGILAVHVLTLEGSNIGMRFLFEPDFSKITPAVVLNALGQCFFSLSIGLGCMITYGAYMPKNQNITSTTVQVVTLDTLVAILAGIIIFPAVFAVGFSPAEGPRLAFVVLPVVFQNMALSWLSGVLFFGLLFIAALTSTISMLEIAVAFLIEATAKKKHPLTRPRSVTYCTLALSVLVVLCALSMTGEVPQLIWGGKNLFEWFDLVTSKILMPLGGLIMCIFLGWFYDKNITNHHLRKDIPTIKKREIHLFLFAIRIFIPIVILLIFLNGIGMI